MVAGAGHASHVAIYAGIDQALRRFLAQEQMIEAKPCVARPAIPQIVPEGVHRLVGMQRADGIHPALVDKPAEQRARLGLNQRILRVRLARIDVALRRHDIEIAGEHHGNVLGIELGGMRQQALHPGELVSEFRAWLRIAVRRIERGNKHAVDRGLDITALAIRRIAGKLIVGQDWLRVAGEDGDAIPSLLAAPDCAVAGCLDCVFREIAVGRFQLLKRDNVRLGRLEPRQKIGEALVDIVDVEGRDLHAAARRAALSAALLSGGTRPVARSTTPPASQARSWR